MPLSKATRKAKSSPKRPRHVLGALIRALGMFLIVCRASSDILEQSTGTLVLTRHY